MNFSKGQFGFDLAFLQSHFDPIILRSADEKQQVIVIPELQGRIMTSTAAGLSGKSFGWINHDLIASKKKTEEHQSVWRRRSVLDGTRSRSVRIIF